MLDIGNKIQKIISDRGLTQKDVALSLSIAPQNFSRVIKNDDFKISFLKELSNILEMPLSVLIYELFEDNGLGNRPQIDQTCINCEAKDRELDTLRQAVISQAEAIHMLKERQEDKSKISRKVG